MKSSYSNTAGCVDVEHQPAKGLETEQFVVTDTKHQGDGPRLVFNRKEWDAFLKGVKDGEFDYPTTTGR